MDVSGPNHRSDILDYRRYRFGHMAVTRPTTTYSTISCFVSLFKKNPQHHRLPWNYTDLSHHP